MIYNISLLFNIINIFFFLNNIINMSGQVQQVKPTFFVYKTFDPLYALTDDKILYYSTKYTVVSVKKDVNPSENNDTLSLDDFIYNNSIQNNNTNRNLDTFLTVQ
jgi:hypothetical protein